MASPSDTAPPVQPVLPVARETGALPFVLAAVIFAALSILAAVTSQGFLEADGCTHYLYSRYALTETHYLVNVWGRPFCTALYAVPAVVGGRLGVRFMSLALALAIAAITYRIAKGQGYRWPALAFIFVLAQPLVFLHSFSELTELPFALLVALAFWAYQRRQWLAMAILVGVMPMARPEGFGFLVLAALALVVHRRWWWLAVLPIPVLLWDYWGWAVFGRPGVWWRWLPDNWPYAAESLYQRGTPFHFIALLPAVVSPFIFPAVCIGVWRSLRILADLCSVGCAPRTVRDSRAQSAPYALDYATGDSRADRPPVVRGPGRSTCQVLIAVIPMLILVGHSFLYWRGKMGSNGELRYMLVVAPFWALLAAQGWEWIFQRFAWPSPLRWAGVAALLPGLVNYGYPVLPLSIKEWEWTRSTADWYRATPLREEYPYLLASHPGLFYFMGMSFSDATKAREWNRQTVTEAPPGTLLVWDPVYGVYNSDAKRSVRVEEILGAGWVELPLPASVPRAEKAEDAWRMFLSPLSRTGHRPSVAAQR